MISVAMIFLHVRSNAVLLQIILIFLFTGFFRSHLIFWVQTSKTPFCTRGFLLSRSTCKIIVIDMTMNFITKIKIISTQMKIRTIIKILCTWKNQLLTEFANIVPSLYAWSVLLYVCKVIFFMSCIFLFLFASFV